MVDPLTRLAVIHGTDKFGYHDYTPNYHTLFSHLRESPVRLMEIGVGGYQDADRGGESLEMWRDYFEAGQITGIDIQKKEMDLGDRVAILQGSQIDAAFLAELVKTRGPFDIIIDDGSHQNEHVVMSFQLLFPTLAAGGIYVAEDVQTSFFPRFGGSLELSPPNSVGFFQAMLWQMPEDVVRISRFHNMIALQKAGATPPPKPGKATRSINARDLTDDPEGQLAAQMQALPDDTLLEITFSDPLPDELGDLFARLFVEIDHREIAINFPDAATGALAPLTYGMHVERGCAVLVKGQNDYPSNFAFDFNHPRAKANFAAMEKLLLREGRERGLLLLADILTRAGEDARVDRLLARAEEIGASSRSFFNAAVRRRKITQDWDGAGRLLDRAVALYPDDYRIRSQLGAIFMKDKDPQAAVEQFQKAVELAPRDVLVRIQLATALARIDRLDEAIEHARKGVEMAPSHAGHKVQLGRLLIAAGNLEEGIETLKAALELDPDNANALRQLSRAHDARGDRAAALAAIKRALELRPDSHEYLRWQERLERG